MRITILIFLTLSFSITLAQDKAREPKGKAKEKMPTTLAEAHAELERILPTDELTRIDAAKSEDVMIKYHRGLGRAIRNRWSLWGESPLSKHMLELGFTHADDMSGVILKTFWCKRHGKPYRLKERAAEYAVYWEDLRKTEEQEKWRVKAAKYKIRSMMMGLRLTIKGLSTVKMPDRFGGSIRARFLAPYHGGVFIAVRKLVRIGSDDFIIEPYFFSSEDRTIHKVHIPELQKFNSVVIAGQTVWCTGVSDEASVLVGINAERRRKIKLPKDGRPPILGLRYSVLLAVYPNSIYELVDGRWKILYSGVVSLPKPGPPPQIFGDVLYLRDEGYHEDDKRLWWLRMGKGAELVSLDRDIGVVGSSGPRWENTYSYAVTKHGELWACVGGFINRKSLLRRSKDGAYSIAIMNNSVKFADDLFGSEKTDQGIAVTAVSLLQDDTILLVGDSGLYRLKGNEISQKLAFTNTRQRIPVNDGNNVKNWSWVPSKVLVLEDNTYFISGAFGGIYLLKKDERGSWDFESLDEELGEAVTW